MPINQPSNQIKLTNVAIVRYKKGGKRYEIACYKNKVQEYRNGVETDLDDVLQINNVFVNVSKGEAAKAEELRKAFGTRNMDEIVKEILDKGELQIGEKERNHELSAMWKEIANNVAERCVDPETQKPIPVGMIEKAMHEAGFSVKPGKNAKSQTLDCIRQIQTNSKLPLQRARMRIKVATPIAEGQRLREEILKGADQVEEEKEGEREWEATLLIDPSQFRIINELLQKEVKGGRLETLTFAATK